MQKFQLSPNLNKAQRKFVHELERKVGLISKSYGVKNNRRITISSVKIHSNVHSIDSELHKTHTIPYTSTEN